MAIAPMTIAKKTTAPMNSTTPSAGEFFFAALICFSLSSNSSQRMAHPSQVAWRVSIVDLSATEWHSLPTYSVDRELMTSETACCACTGLFDQIDWFTGRPDWNRQIA